MPNVFDNLQKLSGQPSRSLLEKCLLYKINYRKVTFYIRSFQEEERTLYDKLAYSSSSSSSSFFSFFVVVVVLTYLTASITAEKMEPHKLSKKLGLVDFWHESPIPYVFKTDLVLYILQKRNKWNAY